MENQYFTTWKIIKYFGCSNDFLRNEKLNSKVKLSNNWYFVILMFAILKFRNIGRSIFRRSKFWPHPTAHNSLWKIGEGTLPWAILRFRIFSNFSQKFEKIKITVWKSDNYVWKFLFRFVLILLHIKNTSKKIQHLAQGRIFDPCLGSYICVSINTE